MFHNSRKTIGVFLERSASEFQNRLCQGIITGAKEIGYNVAVADETYSNHNFSYPFNTFQYPKVLYTSIILKRYIIFNFFSLHLIFCHFFSRKRCKKRCNFSTFTPRHSGARS